MAHDFGIEKYGCDGLLASSAGRNWSGLSAELRSHGRGVVRWTGRQFDTEVCVSTRHSAAIVTRRCGRMVDQTVAANGAVWLSPAGMQGSSIDISDSLPEILHIHLAPDQFSPAALGVTVDPLVASSLRYESGFIDPLVAGIAHSIASELQAETSAGALLIETLAATLSARLIQNHSGRRPMAASTSARIDARRLARVLGYIEDNVEGDLSIDRLASVACLSRFHFARAFKSAVGRPPHRYVSEKRLERAKDMLVRGEQSLVDIALALQFSCQANFTRAFRQVTGLTPGQYRRNTPV